MTSSYPIFTYQPYTLALAGRIAEVVEDYDIEIIHAHYAIPHSVAAFLASEVVDKKLVKVTTLHGTDITILGIDSGFKEMINLALKKSDKVTAVSSWLQGETVKHFNYTGNIQVIYNFVNPRLFHPNQPEAEKVKQRYVKKGETLFIHVSNFRSVKRAPLVVELFAKINKHYPGHLLMIGEGPEHFQAYQSSVELGVSNKVTFLDSVFHLPPYLAAADIFLMPSISESFGLAALEAMACGTPVIASKVGGLPEVIDHGVDGFLCEKDDIDGMVNYAKTLIEEKELLKTLSENCALKPEKKFPYENLVSQYENLYLSLS